MKTNRTKRTRLMTIVAMLLALSSLGAVRSHAGLFKLDFGTLQNSVTLTDWDTFSDWLFTDFPDGVASWKLTDFSTGNNTNVTLTIMDNAALAAQTGVPALGMGSNNPDTQGLDVVYDGINVPAAVKDDYMWHNPDTAGTEILFRFANLGPGQYHVTVFDGRVSDVNGQYGKLWIDDINGNNEPATQNTGDFSANPLSDPNDPNSPRVPTPLGHPQTLVVNIKAGDYLWYAHMEDGWGGISGMIIRSLVEDSDSDGMPDDWEIQYGLNPHDPSDAVKDLNGNGLSNLFEYQSGLDPTDTTRPTIRSVLANSLADKVEVTFSKPLFTTGSAIANDPRDPTLATNLANYSISPALAITGVDVKNNVVTLTTAQPTPGVTVYTLTVNNVRDINNWPVAPNTTATFSMGTAAASSQPKIYQWMTIAGKAGVLGSADGTNSGIRFHGTYGVALDGKHDLFVSDGINATIRKLVPDRTNWVSSTIAGKAGAYGIADGTNSEARFGYSSSLGGMGNAAVDSSGSIFVGDFASHTIRKITPQGSDWVTSTIAGKARVSGSADGTNNNARFNLPNSVSFDQLGNLYVLDAGNHTIRRMTPVGTDWVTTTIAGKAGASGNADGTNNVARFRFGDNGDLVVDDTGTLFIGDIGNHTIRKISPVGTDWVTTTIAGKAGVAGTVDGVNSAARFHNPVGVAVDGRGGLFVADLGNHTIRKITPEGTNWVVTTIGGKAGAAGGTDGTNSVARFNYPISLTADFAGNVYLGEVENNAVRMGVPLPVFESATPVNGSIELTVNAAPGQTVQLQYSSTLVSGTWTNLGNPITAANSMISVDDTPAPDQPRFYRAIVVLP